MTDRESKGQYARRKEWWGREFFEIKAPGISHFWNQTNSKRGCKNEGRVLL